MPNNNTMDLIISRVALYQASVSGLCDGTCWSVGRSIRPSVRLCTKCIVAKRLSESRCCFGWWVGSVGMGVLDRGGRRREGAVWGWIWGSHCNQWGLCDAALTKLLLAGLVKGAECAICKQQYVG